jgi:hypothetical protein
MYSNFFFEYHAVYEVMCGSIVEPDSPPMRIWRMRISCWIPKAGNTDAAYVIRTAFRLQQWLHERTSLVRTLHVRFPSCTDYYAVLILFVPPNYA